MRKLLLTYISLLLCVLAWAQNGTSVATDFPYECGFEENEDLSAWNLNPNTPTAKDKWIFGTAVHSEGKRSMYISAYGNDCNYGGSKNVSVSYLRYKFPTAAKTQSYEVSFDWKGVGDSATSKLYVTYCPESRFLTSPINNPYHIDTVLSNSSNGRLSGATINVCEGLGDSGEKFICGSEAWQNISFSRKVSVRSDLSSENFVFVFIWVNENTQDSLGRTSIAIDNFQINTASISKPANLQVYPQCEDSSLLLTWEATGATEFDLQYRKVGETEWGHGRTGLTDGSEGFSQDGSRYTYSLKPILEGSYDIRIRSAYYDEVENTTMHTGYVYQSMILVYCPENHCVNYINLDAPGVVCTTGYFPGYNSPGDNPYMTVGKVDYGPDAVESRHTLHIDPAEVDPRTDSLLHTVPNGALASVRLGNWNWGGEAESVTYTIHVDSFSQGILLVQYAVVFEDPDHEDEPTFNLEILKPDGTPFEDKCGQESFTYSDAENDPDHWHITRNGNVAWKDWTTVGVPIMAYHGQDIKVRFTTMDCGWGGHFGYAYFTVDCANAHIETENCGSDAYVSCVAPEGFDYMWYKDGNYLDTVGTDRTFIVEATGGTYTCRASFKEQPDCFIEISTVSDPRFPIPEYTYEPVFGECRSKLQFNNTSHVMTVNPDGTEKHSSEKCNETRWTFRSLVTGRSTVTTKWSPEYTCRNNGDTVEVTATSYIGAENTCDSTRVDTIITPNIIPEPTEFHYTSCSEEPVRFNDQWFDQDTMYVGHFTTYAGCDSVSTLFLKVYPKPQDQYRHDSICSDQSLTIAGVKYTRPLDNYQIMLKNENGCDSAVYLTLTVNERLKATIDSVPYSCLDEGQMYIWMDITAGVYDSLVIRFNTPLLRDTVIYEQVTGIAIPFSEDVLPGHYAATLTFHQFCCGIYTQTRGFDIRYPSAIVEQKWNDVLTLLSPKYNGGYDFLSFQWYKNGMPIFGENHSYLYQQLDFDAEYYVELMRRDSVIMTTCPIRPVYHEQQTPYPTIVQAGQHMPMYMDHPVTIWYYTISGQLYSTFALPQGYTSLPTPGQPGAFVIKSVNSEGETQAQVMIVQ
ncbi:MAG: immunoglobulin domain-containing protein [Paludibacteraceae bacterium]|nr:immunoglobulin domain-containing protein [Paludibacteraceae bacterium]